MLKICRCLSTVGKGRGTRQTGSGKHRPPVPACLAQDAPVPRVIYPLMRCSAWTRAIWENVSSAVRPTSAISSGVFSFCTGVVCVSDSICLLMKLKAKPMAINKIAIKIATKLVGLKRLFIFLTGRQNGRVVYQRRRGIPIVSWAQWR